ncbi:MAG: T9SS type A sorting domain-containing protein [Ferruginibacter sp.]
MKKNEFLLMVKKSWLRYAVILSVFILSAYKGMGQDDPDMPPFMKKRMNPETYMTLRSEAVSMRRGVDKNKPFDPARRQTAINMMMAQRSQLLNSKGPQVNAATSPWIEIGPNPIPNGQSTPQLPVSGRTTAIAVHPSNPDILYVGTAQGGVYRSINGGATWVPMLDNAMSLAIGAVAISPSQPETVYIGTGEPNFSADSYFGVGVYRIDNASSATPTITGPLNRDAANADIFTGRGIGEILVHPTDPNTIFVATTSGVGGIGGVANNILPSRGIYRSTNATTANPVFNKLTGLEGNGNFSIRDMILDPLNPNLLVCNLIANGGGIYVSTDALAASPTFIRRVTFSSASTNELTAEFAIQHTAGPNPVIYAATGNGGGRVLMSIDGGTTWTQQIDNNFCTPQCFYDIAIDVDPTNSARVYLGGAPAIPFAFSTNSGASFTTSAVGLHVDSHTIAVSASNPTVIYFGSDGGIYKSINSGVTWASLNNSTFRATQFTGLAMHPLDPNFTIGGTQDNGTNFYRPNATWNRIDFGDGGYSAIDQNAADNTNVVMYHTYFNQTNNLIGFGRVLNTTCASEGEWAFKGRYGGAVDPTPYCDGSTDSFNGIAIGDPVLFYAPLALGPGNPNTVYFGTNKLYRSANRGDLMPAVSQALSSTISAIGISRQDDNVRIVGQSNGGLFGTVTGSSTLVNLDAGNVVPNNFVGRAVIDPNNINTAYVTLCGFAVGNVWKTTNLNNAAPTWTAASTGIPQVPVNAFVVDPANSNNLYAGTDIGVYASTDGGTSWVPYGVGLPVVAVFDMGIQQVANKLRIATHGRGMWEISIAPPPATITAGAVTGSISTCQGTASASPALQQFDVSGAGLIANITVTAPANFEVSTSTASGYSGALNLTQSGGNVASTTIYVRTAASAPSGLLSGNVVLSSSGAPTVNVAVSATVNANPVFTAPVSTSLPNVDYSDPITPATITVTDDGPGTALTASTQFKVGAGAFAAGLPASLSLVLASTGANTRSWTLSGIANVAPGTYTIRVTVTDGQCSSYIDITLVVECEDVSILYTGLQYVQTSSNTSTTGVLTVSATLTDALDGYSGDIRNALVQFIVTPTTAGASVSGSPAAATVTLVDAGDLTIGTATAQVTLNLGGNPCATYEVLVMVNGYYCGTLTVPVAMAMPNGDFVTGGGFMNAVNSAGQYAADNNNGSESRINFGFNCKYNKSGKNLQGNANVIFRKDGKTYQIKSNAVQSLSVNSSTKTATFITKANLSEIVNGLPVPVSLSSYLILRIDMLDNGEPGIHSDEIGITASVNGGGMIFSSKWVSGNTARQVLDGGNLVVRGGGTTTAAPVTTEITKENAVPLQVVPEVSDFTVRAVPNPSTSSFSVFVASPDKMQQIKMQVTDATGKLVETREILGDKNVELGYNYRPGTYILKFIQGKNHREIKLVKLPG